MSLNVELLRSSFSLVATRNPQLTKRFYEILFTRYPQVKPMFSRNSPRQQEHMLAAALVAVVDHLEDSPWLVQTLEGLGRKHAEYGVERAMYEWVGECLIATLQEVAGNDWSREMEQAWLEAYGTIVSLMWRAPRPVAPLTASSGACCSKPPSAAVH
jgi:hemoglobin-like flavoprotein